MSRTFKFARYGGYECSSKGDKRFSAFNAMLPDGRSIEQHYQCDVKGYDPGGKNWRAGKGKPPLNELTDAWTEYLRLWKQWAATNKHLLDELRVAAARNNDTLSDMFATGPINQARALAELLNDEEL